MEQYRAFKDSWSVNSFKKRYEKGEINFDNPIQRGIVWNKKMSSLYIHSLLYDILIYQKPFLISKKKNGWDVLDGKQRGNSLINYINNEYALSGLEKEPPIVLRGQPYPINGKLFKQLDDDLKMKILDFQIDMAVLEDAPVKIEALFFERSNSGKAMAKVDLARSRNMSMSTVKEVAQHEIFKAMFSENVLKKLPQDEIVVKTWQAFNETEPDYSAKHFQELMETLEITEQDKFQIVKTYDRIFEAYKKVFIADKVCADAMMKKTHFLSYVAFAERFDTSQDLADWIIEFYKEMPEKYLEASTQQTTSLRHIRARVEVIKESVDKFLSDHNPDKGHGLTRGAEYFKRKLDKND